MKKRQTQAGFTLVETFVAIVILLIAIVGPMTITTSTVRSTTSANERVVAYFLAQEGIELVQKIRDDLLLRQFNGEIGNDALWDVFSTPSVSSVESLLQGMYNTPNPWTTWDQCFNQNTGCGLELKPRSLNGELRSVRNCLATGNNCQLYYLHQTETRSPYTHYDAPNIGGSVQPTTKTPYKRIITITEDDDRQIMVESRVTWRTDGQRREQEVVLRNYLFNLYND